MEQGGDTLDASSRRRHRGFRKLPTSAHGFLPHLEAGMTVLGVSPRLQRHQRAKAFRGTPVPGRLSSSTKDGLGRLSRPI